MLSGGQYLRPSNAKVADPCPQHFPYFRFKDLRPKFGVRRHFFLLASGYLDQIGPM